MFYIVFSGWHDLRNRIWARSPFKSPQSLFCNSIQVQLGPGLQTKSQGLNWEDRNQQPTNTQWNYSIVKFYLVHKETKKLFSLNLWAQQAHFFSLGQNDSQFNPWIYIHVSVRAYNKDLTSDKKLQGFMQCYLIGFTLILVLREQNLRRPF